MNVFWTVVSDKTSSLLGSEKNVMGIFYYFTIFYRLNQLIQKILIFINNEHNH